MAEILFAELHARSSNDAIVSGKLPLTKGRFRGDCSFITLCTSHVHTGIPFNQWLFAYNHEDLLMMMTSPPLHEWSCMNRGITQLNPKQIGIRVSHRCFRGLQPTSFVASESTPCPGPALPRIHPAIPCLSPYIPENKKAVVLTAKTLDQYLLLY